jgi:catalase
LPQSREGGSQRSPPAIFRDRLATRIVGVLGQARKELQMRELCNFLRADEVYRKRVAEKLGIDVNELVKEAVST